MEKNKLVIFSIICFLAFLFLLFLGSWQVKRLLWKNEVIAKIEQRSQEPEVELEGEIDLTANEYRKVLVEGKFLHEQEIHLYTGPMHFKGDPGYNIITPILTNKGEIFLIDRGWVPAELKSQDTRPETLITDYVKITGMIMKEEEPGWFTPDNDVKNNLWFYVENKKIYETLDSKYKPFFIRLIADSKEYPIPGNTNINIRNDHLEYAITWYALAIILLVIYVIILRNSIKGNKNI